MAISIMAKKEDGEARYRVWSTTSECYLVPWSTREATVEFLEGFYAGMPRLLKTAITLMDVAFANT